MDLRLYFKRKTKSTFLRLGLHRLLSPFTNIFMNLAYLSKFSKWRAGLKKPPFDDFYSSKFLSTRRYDNFDFVLKNEIRNSTIDYLEFGVAEGRSFKWWIEHHKDANSRFYGFDTFTGLPENWDFYRQGDMTAGGKTPVVTDSRCLFIKGLFQETLPFFLKDYKRQDKLVVHLDADLYSSTLYVLASLAPVLKAGDILVFDEFGVPTHEFKAFEDFTSAFYMKYELIAAGNNYFQIALKIL